MPRRLSLLVIAALVGFLTSTARADVQTTGKIAGLVQAEDGSPLPGATVTLTGEQLIARSLTETTNENGVFRFLNLQPGQYTVTIALTGFVSQEIATTARLGQTTSVEVKLQLVRAQEQVTVRGEAPLIDKTSPKLSTLRPASTTARRSAPEATSRGTTPSGSERQPTPTTSTAPR